MMVGILNTHTLAAVFAIITNNITTSTIAATDDNKENNYSYL